MANYFNTLSLREQLTQLGKCRFMDSSEFADGVTALKGKKIVIVGCGAQGLNQGLNMRDSGLDISYALRPAAIKEQRQSYKNAKENNFTVGTYEELIPTADLVINLTPDKQHTNVVSTVMPLMKKGATLSYSHGFNIVEEGMQVREDLTVIMVAPKSPGSEVREEYKRGFGVPTLIAVHPENDPEGKGLEQAKAYAAATGGDKAGVLESSFVAEVKSDLMGGADHSLWFVANRFYSFVQQNGGKRSGRSLCLQIDSIWLGNHHRRIEAGWNHQHDGPFVESRQDQGI
jgi:ketol-acid reductoisomerase